MAEYDVELKKWNNSRKEWDTIHPYTKANNVIREDGSSVEGHFSDTNNPHKVTKEQVGLGNVLNVEQASKEEFNSLVEKTDEIDSEVQDIIKDLDSHSTNTDNPHNVTKDQVGLGNVLNIEQASKEDLDSLSSEVSDISDLVSEHVNNSENPHNVTKSQIGLGNVLNVEQASKEEFDFLVQDVSEIDSDVAMLVERFNSHEESTSNPHNVTKDQVGLGNVDNVKQASKTEFDEHKEKVDAMADEIDLRVTREEFENLQIGGRNLLKNSGNFKSIDGWSDGVVVEKDGYRAIEVPNGGTIRNTHYVALEPDTYYVYSGWLMSSVDIPSSEITETRPLHYQMRSGGSNFGARESAELLTTDYPEIIPANTWFKIEVLLKTRSNIDDDAGFYAYVHSSDTYSETFTSHKYWLRDFKLEKGTKATDWTPALEDTQSQIDSAVERIASTEEKLDVHEEAINARAHQDELLNYVDKQTYNNKISELTTDLESISSNVNSLQTEVDGIQIGGRNLIRDSKERIANPTGESTNSFLNLELTESLPPNTPYSFQADFEFLSGSSNTIRAYLRDSEGSAAKHYEMSIDSNKGTITFSSNSGINVEVGRIYLYAGTLGNTEGNIVKFTNIKFEKGNKPTDWTPAPEDIDDDISAVSARIDDLKISGRNLFSPSDIAKNRSSEEVTKIAPYSFYATSNWSALSERFIISEGETLTVSFWAKTETEESDILRTQRIGFTTPSGNTRTSVHPYNAENVTQEWQYYESTFTVEDGTEYMEFYARTDKGKVWINGLMIVRGNKAPSDWMPAPEDIQSQIDEALELISSVIGNDSKATQQKAVAFGTNASAEGTYSAALGAYSTALNANEGVLGSRTVAGTSDWKVPGSFTVEGTKNFEMPHPHPDKKYTHRLRHSAVESPTAGENLYRFTVKAEAANETVEVELPDYFPYLNKNVDVWVNGHKHFGRAFGEVEDGKLKVTCEESGEYKVLVIGTRNDDHPSVQNWDIKGVEREIGESWTGETYVFEFDEILEVEEIKEVM